jgi:hypothetical protein
MAMLWSVIATESTKRGFMVQIVIIIALLAAYFYLGYIRPLLAK